MTAYQFLGPYVIVLPRPESLEVGHFKANIEIIWPTSDLPRDPKIGMQSRFGSNSMVEFDSKIPQKIWLPHYIVSTELKEGQGTKN